MSNIILLIGGNLHRVSDQARSKVKSQSEQK